MIKKNKNLIFKFCDNHKLLLKQMALFFLVSGIGWCIDFFTYVVLTQLNNFPVSYANIISSLPAITYVFIMSNKNIFKNKKSNLKKLHKYLIYFGYQLMLIVVISFIGQIIYNYLSTVSFFNVGLLCEYLKIIIKIMITPITMVLNFIVMKNLIEKL